MPVLSKAAATEKYQHRSRVRDAWVEEQPQKKESWFKRTFGKKKKKKNAITYKSVIFINGGDANIVVDVYTGPESYLLAGKRKFLAAGSAESVRAYIPNVERIYIRIDTEGSGTKLFYLDWDNLDGQLYDLSQVETIPSKGKVFGAELLS